MVVAASCYGYACHRQGLESFLNNKNKRNRAKQRQNSRGKPGTNMEKPVRCILNKNINTTCKNVYDFTELQFILYKEISQFK
jgi:hypothetical protein